MNLKNYLLVLGASSVLFLSSCLESDTIISVNKDGSGMITETVLHGQQMTTMMKMAARTAKGDAEDPLLESKKTAVARKAADFGPGVEVVSVKRKDEGEFFGFETVYKFKNINAVTLDPSRVMDDGKNAVKADERSFTFTLAEGALEVAIPEPRKQNIGYQLPNYSVTEMNAMIALVTGFDVSVQVALEGGIGETNATYEEAGVVTLLALNLDEIHGNEGGFESALAVRRMDREKAAGQVKQVNGLELETQETVTLKFE